MGAAQEQALHVLLLDFHQALLLLGLGKRAAAYIIGRLPSVPCIYLEFTALRLHLGRKDELSNKGVQRKVSLEVSECFIPEGNQVETYMMGLKHQIGTKISNFLLSKNL